MATPKPLSPGQYVARRYAISRYGRGLATEEAARLAALVRLMGEALVGIDPGSLRQPRARQRAWERVTARVLRLAKNYARNGRRDMAAAYTQLVDDATGMSTGVINHALGIDAFKPTKNAAYKSLLADMPVMRQPLSQIWDRQASDVAERFMRATKTAINGGRTAKQAMTSDILARELKTATRHIRVVADTAVAQAHAEGMMLGYRQAGDIIEGYEHVATLDRRTCTTCMALDGLVWIERDGRMVGRGHGQLWGPPPSNTHYWCRCLILPVLVALRDMPKNIRDAIPAGKRAAVAGPVSDTVRAEDWIKTRDASELRAQFGPTRAQALLDGRATLVDLITTDNVIKRAFSL